MKGRKFCVVLGKFLCRLPPFPIRSIIRGNLDTYNYLKVLLLNARTFRFRVKYLKGTYLWLTDDWSYNYYHWTFDILIKIRNVDADPEIPVLVPASFSRNNRFVIQSLESMGFRVMETEEHIAYIVGKTLTGSMPSYFDSRALRELRDRSLQSCISVQKNDIPVRLFISRKHAPRRGLLNEFEVASLLKRYGFVVCTPESMTWQEQVELFRNAEVIVGMHGAGLSNMIYAASAQLVIEFRAKAHENNLFMNLSKELQIPYELLRLESEITDFHGPSFLVDRSTLADLESRLQLFLKHTSENRT